MSVLNELIVKEIKGNNKKKTFYIRVFHKNEINTTFMEGTEDNYSQFYYTPTPEKNISVQEMSSEILPVCDNMSQ